MRRLTSIFLPIILAASARAQSSMSACGPRPDSSARQVIRMSGGVRVCLLAAKLTADADLPRDWAANARTLILETQRDGDNRRAAISGARLTWTINGKTAPVDSLADAWQKAVVDYADAAYQADEVRRQDAALHAEIDSLPDRILAAKVRINYLEDRDRKLNLQILSAGNGESAARAQIGRLESQRSAAQSRASSAEAQAAAARDDRTRASLEAQARAARQQADGLAESIRGLERGTTGAGTSQTVAAAQEELRALKPQQNIALLKLQLANFESVNVSDLEREIRELDAPQRLPALDAQVETTRLALVAILEARGKAPSR